METIKILEAKCEVTEGGMACGPVDGHVVATVKYQDSTGIHYLNEVEVQSTPNFYLTEEDKFEEFVTEDFDNEEWCDYMDDNFIEEFKGYELDGEYDFIQDTLDDKIGYGLLLRYIVTIVRSDFDEMEEFIEKTVGKNVDEIEFIDLDILEFYK